MSVDDDDGEEYANLEKPPKRRNLGDGEEYGNLEKPPKRMKMGAVGVGLQMKLISDEDLNLHSQIPYGWLHYRLKPCLPAMADTFDTKNWSNLKKYWTDPSVVVEHLGFKEEALQQELVAICVWFLLSNRSSSDTKVCVASALQIILHTEAPKPTNTSIDQVFVDALVVDALRSGDKEIIRQVCMTIYFAGAIISFDANVGTSVQFELVELARRGADACFAGCLLDAINVIGKNYDKSCVMRKKLVEAVLSDREWLMKLLSDPDEDLVASTYSLLEIITRGKYDASLWEALSKEIIPSILKKYGRGFSTRLRMLGSKVISNAINGLEATDETDEDIEALVRDSKDKGDIIFVLIWVLEFYPEFGDDAEQALWKILEVGDWGLREDNEFAVMVTESYGWDAIYNRTPYHTLHLLEKYAPLDFLRGVMLHC